MSPEKQAAFVRRAQAKNAKYEHYRSRIYREIAVLLNLPDRPEKPDPGELDLMDEELG